MHYLKFNHVTSTPQSYSLIKEGLRLTITYHMPYLIQYQMIYSYLII